MLLKVRVDVAVLVVAKVILGMVLTADNLWSFLSGHGLVNGQYSWFRRPLVAKVRLSSRDVVTSDVESVFVSNIVQAPGIAVLINVAVVSLDLRIGVARLVLLKIGVGVAVLVVAELILGMVLLADNS